MVKLLRQRFAERHTVHHAVARFWIPACAGMTGWGAVRHDKAQPALRTARSGAAGVGIGKQIVFLKEKRGAQHR
jgi:D-arabinose 1-dehydrogenase-like Zn-dependent alcohol dehydrogenase